MNSKKFWFHHPKLIRLIAHQCVAVTSNNQEDYEQCRLDILSTIDELRESMVGDTQYGQVKDIFV